MTDPEFWHSKWEKDEIGFHRSEVHPSLERFWIDLHKADKGAVFVPLCGKSLDILWLADQRQEVIGVELSEIALRTFFEENDLPYATKAGKRFQIFKSGPITLLLGDYFDLTRSDLGGVRSVYDRAALIALPPDMQDAYVAHQQALLASGTDILLFTVAYDQELMNGPPFSTPVDRVEQLYDGWCQITHLATSKPEDIRGTSALEEAFHLRVK